MRHNRFEEIIRFFHYIDDTKIVKRNKMSKIQPLINKIKNKCSQYFVPEQNLSYDESKVKYYKTIYQEQTDQIWL